MTRAQTAASLALWRRRRNYREHRLVLARRAKDPARVAKWAKLLSHARYMVSLRRRQQSTIATRTLRAAEALVGVMEHGGNNRGAQVEAIIKANGGDVGEPWCGDFVAHCARTAGSTAVTRAWASVRALRTIAGVHPTTKPTPGDLVTFTFDHVGIYVGNHGNEIETIEGNTGSSGAVSDSANGGDGVYRKRRAKSLVHEYLHLTR